MNIFESVIDQTLKNYSKFVFDDYKTTKPKLKGRVRQKIIDDVKKINKKIGVVEFFIKGSILTKQYSKNADIDIFVRVNPNLYTEDQLRRLLKPLWEQIDDTYLDGCPYPFQYYITKDKYNTENTEAMYDVLNDEWIKKSSSKSINIDDYIDDFKKYVEQFSDFSEELRRNMIDYDILLDIPSDQIKGLKQKLDQEMVQINKSIDDLSEVYKEVRDMRNDAFSEEMTPSEIKKYGIKTRLPGNVVFKLLERYYYLDLYKKIRKIIGDDGKISHSEYDELNNVLKTKLTTEKTSFKNVFGNVKGRRDMQHKPRHRQQQANAGMLGHGTRKSVNLMPDYQRSKGIKGDHAIDGAKNNSRVIRVKQGTPEASRLAKKYRIDNPVGKKTVAGNQHDQGITIIFEETINQKIKSINENLNNLEKYDSTKKYSGIIPEIKYLPVSHIFRQEMDFRPEVLEVSDETARNMDFTEPVEVVAYAFGSAERDRVGGDEFEKIGNSRSYPSVTVSDGHHRTAAALQLGKEFLPVEVRAINASGEKIRNLIKLSYKYLK